MVHLRIHVAVGAATLLLLATPGGALAAGRPTATTGPAANVSQQTVTLTGTVTPNGAPTTYFFQLGPTRIYTVSTAPGTATRKLSVAVPVTGLTPFTTYHYRLVAQNSHGISRGKDRAFRTLRQPFAISLAASPNPVLYGGSTTLGGALSGTGNAGQAVVLQSNPFPYTQGFATVSNPQVTNAQGGFAFPVVSLGINTQFRVLMTNRPSVVSPILTVYSQVRVSTHLKRHHTRRGLFVRFYGAVTPANDAARYAIQRFTKGQWRTIAGSITHHRSTTSSRYSKRVRIRHSGSYRVYVEIKNGLYVSNVGRTVHIRR